MIFKLLVGSMKIYALVIGNGVCLKFGFDFQGFMHLGSSIDSSFCLLRGVLVSCFLTSPTWGAHGLLGKPTRVLYHVCLSSYNKRC
jgi:hypothetical protein